MFGAVDWVRYLSSRVRHPDAPKKDLRTRGSLLLLIGLYMVSNNLPVPPQA